MATKNTSGVPSCPKCGATMRPMFGKAAGKGWNCTKGQYVAARRCVVGCDGVIWNKSTWTKKEETPRAADWLKVKQMTDEQAAIDKVLGMAPHARGSRMVIIDAGPGTGKSTTMAMCAYSVYRRVGSLLNWHMCAFNVNARIALERKLPQLWANVATINGFGGRLQGFNARQYKTAKVRNIFKDLTDAIPKEEKPRYSIVGALCERGRDLLLFSSSETDRAFWDGAISALCARFPGIQKRMDKEKHALEVAREYFPLLMVRSLNNAKEIDLTEQYARPGLQAAKLAGWRMPFELCDKSHEWTDKDIEHLASLIRRVDLPQIAGVVVDEAQDLSLSQIVLFLAATWRNGELILVGDDKRGAPGDADYKAGQAIFGWRGAFPGSLTLIARLWAALTGETAIRLPLSVTFRCPPEVVDAVRPLNATLKSAKSYGNGAALSLSVVDAFNRWLDLPEKDNEDKEYRALWICRRNAPLAEIFKETLRAQAEVCLRGGGDFAATVDRALFEAAGWYDDNGEYKVSLSDCLDNLRELTAEEEENNGESLESFLLSIGEEVQKNPAMLSKADLPHNATVGNLRRFVIHFSSKDARRVLSTVYRAKGDEAALTIVDDTAAFNTAWNGDEDEAAACRLVACTRASETLIVCGSLAGVNIAGAAPMVKEEMSKPATRKRRVKKEQGPTLFDGEAEALRIESEQC